MAGSVNKVILVGRLGRDPEIKSFQSGGRIANLSLATSENWKDRTSGERKERTEWHHVVIKGDGLVGVAERYLKKGSNIYVEGKLQTRKWQDQNGNDRYSTEVVLAGHGGILTMLGGPPERSGGGRSNNDSRGGDYAQGGRSGGGNDWGGGGGSSGSWDDPLDDDIPF